MERTNCKNCGAILHYDSTGKAKCEYCSSEYFLDNINKPEVTSEIKITADGIISKVTTKVASDTMPPTKDIELEIHGRKMRFYISSIECLPIYYIDPLRKPKENFKVTLISY